METKTIHINVNLATLISEFQIKIQRIINLVFLGLNAKTKLPKNISKIPGVDFSLSLSHNMDWDDETSRREFQEWILINGFRDASELISNFLEYTNRILSLWELVRKQNNNVQLRGDDWNEFVAKNRKQFPRFGLPDKINHLINQKNLQLDQELISNILSINMARNCLVHRSGIVSKLDTNIEGGLEVKWRKLTLYLKNKDGEQEINFPHHVEQESQLFLKQKTYSKMFKLNESISFSAQEFSDICWCLFVFGRSIVEGIEAIGKKSGFIKDKEKTDT